MNSVTTKETGQEGKEQDTGTGGDVVEDSTAASSQRNYNTVTGLCRTMACVFGWSRTGRTAPQLRRIFWVLLANCSLADFNCGGTLNNDHFFGNRLDG